MGEMLLKSCMKDASCSSVKKSCHVYRLLIPPGRVFREKGPLLGSYYFECFLEGWWSDKKQKSHLIGGKEPFQVWNHHRKTRDKCLPSSTFHLPWQGEVLDRKRELPLSNHLKKPCLFVPQKNISRLQVLP